MSRNAKIGIGVIAGLLVLCVCVCGGAFLATSLFGGQIAKNMTTTDPAQVQAKAQQIIDYQLPPGFHESMAMNIVMAQMVLFSSPDDTTQIMLMQMNPGTQSDPASIRQGFQQGMQRALPGGWQQVDRKTMTIRGQQVTVTTSEGKMSDGSVLRQMSTDPFNGKAGLVLVSIYGPANNWPEEDINNFLSSIQ